MTDVTSHRQTALLNIIISTDELSIYSRSTVQLKKNSKYGNTTTVDNQLIQTDRENEEAEDAKTRVIKQEGNLVYVYHH